MFSGQYDRSNARIREEDLEHINGWESVRKDDRQTIRVVTELLVGLHQDTTPYEGPESIYIVALDDRYVLIAEYMNMIRLGEFNLLRMNIAREIGGDSRIQELGYTPSYDLSEHFSDITEKVHGLIVSISSIDAMEEIRPIQEELMTSSPPLKRRKRSRSVMERLPFLGSLFVPNDDPPPQDT